MKRNMDLVRDILLHLDALSEERFVEPEEIAKAFNYTPEFVQYHFRLIYQAGFVEGVVFRGKKDFQHSTKVVKDDDQIFWVKPKALSWDGHEFLETIRDPEVWAKSKEGAKKIGSFGLDVLKDLGKGYIKKKIKTLTDVEIDV